jgi:O-antigen/teichoic acid export membrane protein
MTRLLFPAAFGQIAVATSLVAGLILVSDLGIHAVILQSPSGDQERFLRSAWTLQALRGLGLWVMLVSLCGLTSFSGIQMMLPADSVFAASHFFLITSVYGFSVVLSGLESTAINLNVRRLNLRPIVFLDLFTRVFSLPVMIVWALIAPSVWALVGGALTGSIARLITSHVLVPGPRMHFEWDKLYVREIIHFGRWVAVSSIATFLRGQSDRLIFAFLLPDSVLGLYAIAKMLVDTVEGILERLNATLTLPVLGEVIRSKDDNFRTKYYTFRFPFELAAPMLSGVLVSAGALIVHVLFDARYSDAGPMLQILSIGLITYPALFFGGAFTAIGATNVSALISVLQAVSFVIFVSLGYVFFGVSGSLWGIALYKFIPSGIVLILASRRGWVEILKEARVILTFLAGLIIGEAVTKAIHGILH